ncbi:helicase domino-like [Octopus vulgaris]|nr:helicase domino-like [Octopus vulgaris]
MVRTPKSPTSPAHRLNTRQQAISAVYDSAIGSQEAIVERAKQEAQVMHRVAELRKDGLWSARRLPKVQEPIRNKAHWDYLLEEMQWLAADFAQERKWKKAAARKLSRMVAKYHQEQDQKEQKAVKEEAQKLKRIAGQVAKQVKEFWANIEKVVQYKQQTRLEEKRRKALDIHLNFIVDQTEKYSSWLTESLAKSDLGKGVSSSVVGSITSTPEHSNASGDDDFEPDQSETDDEETIDKEERETGNNESIQDEIALLQKEGDVPLEELLKSLPEEILEKPAELKPERKIKVSESEEKVSDEEFQTEDQEEEDMEDTIEEQEKHERNQSHLEEISELEKESEMSIEELIKKYEGAYNSDFEMPDVEESGDTTEDTEEYGSDNDETEEEEDQEEEEDDDDDDEEDSNNGVNEEIGLEYLMHPEIQEGSQSNKVATLEGKAPGKEITDIAAEAQSLQPKGYTLETTQVKVAVPFLLKHTLREYQHVGLDWLATMHEKKLNGILADEMGLGKTIQTIALLAHLACEKGIWGPHLIVVPTSVMLNWEMELKKWCPAFKILTYYGNPKERKAKRTGWTKTNAFHVCITSYKLVIQDHQAFRRKKWKYFILDEAQNIKNFKSQRWQTLLNFQSQRRLLLTGTPLQNSLMELWSLMHFLMPNVFSSHKDFKEWFANPLSGMIEGSHEYNDNLIKRLHKVLRPFLLRRLKDDVEKQMPKKYEHVVMCRLSKRQRFLYDEFMSQTKTKETLASGHFMSVINVLMQLRKVCNHPNLFDPRPIVSPLQMQGLVYSTASQVVNALETGPFDSIDLRLLYPSLCDMEYDLPKFISERVKKTKTPRHLIMEIDSQPDPPPRPKPAKLKTSHLRSSSPFVQSGRASPVSQSTSTAPGTTTTIVTAKPNIVKPVVATHQSTTATVSTGTSTPSLPIRIGLVPQHQIAQQIRTTLPHQQSQSLVPGTTSSIAAVVLSSASVGTSRPTLPQPSIATIQTKVLPHGALHTSGTAAVSTTSSSTPVLSSQPITVQIQQTDQGTRLMIPTGQLSQFSTGFIQIIQTSGQQFIAASTPPVQSVIPVQTVTSTCSAVPVVNGPGLVSNLSSTTSVASSSSSASVVSVPAVLKTIPTVNLPITTAAATAGKPVMKVQPLSTELPSTMHYQSQQKQISLTTSQSKPAPIILATAAAAVTSTKTTTAAPQSTPAAATLSTTLAQAIGRTSLQGQTSISLTSASGFTNTKLVAAKAVVQQPKSELFLECLYQKRKQWRKEKLDHLDRINKKHCDMNVIYGQDLLESVNLLKTPEKAQSVKNLWHGIGHFHCKKVHLDYSYSCNSLWSRTAALENMVNTPEKYLNELSDILSRFVFVIPPVTVPFVKLHVSHPSPSSVARESFQRFMLHNYVSPQTACLHKIDACMSVQFPELRLIQYDCGKLQTLDVLLRQLKTGNHRVLIFTQMTKMLDVLEAFLNYHGHRYLRLDGTTRVEQRQALMERFNADKRIFVFILSTRSGGIGVNLTGADTVIFYDSDWNPTMDAQAQDRCHRIGQTRDVHIYRLISERTIEENILKKADQKRLLGDVAIEGGNFTTAFFKQNTIKELFDEPTGLQALAKERETKKRIEWPKEAKVLTTTTSVQKPAVNKVSEHGKESNLITQLEQALCKAEDETDVMAADLVKAEQKAELAEFDENIPWDDKEAERKQDEDETSKVEMELSLLEKELSPVERYAVLFLETQMEPFCSEELQMAEEDIESAKKDWELARLKSLKEEEEIRAELEEDEMLFTYTRDDAYNQVKKSKSKKNSGNKSNKKKSNYKNFNSRQNSSDEKITSSRKSSRRSAASSDIAKSRSNGLSSSRKSLINNNEKDENSSSRGGKMKGINSVRSEHSSPVNTGMLKHALKKDVSKIPSNPSTQNKATSNQKVLNLNSISSKNTNSVINTKTSASSTVGNQKLVGSKRAKKGVGAKKKVGGPGRKPVGSGKKGAGSKKSNTKKANSNKVASTKKLSGGVISKKSAATSTVGTSTTSTTTSKKGSQVNSVKKIKVNSKKLLRATLIAQEKLAADLQVAATTAASTPVPVSSARILETAIKVSEHVKVESKSTSKLPTNTTVKVLSAAAKTTHTLSVSTSTQMACASPVSTSVTRVLPVTSTGTSVPHIVPVSAATCIVSGSTAARVWTTLAQKVPIGHMMPIRALGQKIQVPMSALTQKVPVNTITQKVPISTITQVPVSAITQVPISSITQVPVSAISQKKVPVSTITHVPVSAITQKIPGTAVTQVPITAITQKVPIKTYSQKVPVTTITQKVPITTITQKIPSQKVPVPIATHKIPVTFATQKLPVSVLQQKLPVSVLQQKLPVSVLQQKLPVTIAAQKLPTTSLTPKFIVSTPTQKLLFSTPTQKLLVPTQAQKLLVTSSTQKILVSAPTQKLLVATPTQTHLVSTAPSQKLPLISTPTQTVPVSTILPKAAVTTSATQNCPTVNHVGVESVLSGSPTIPVKYTQVVPAPLISIPVTTATSSPQPWSNPNLVIRTRRASMQESKKRADTSESVDADDGVEKESAEHVINVTNKLNNIIIDLPESLLTTDTLTNSGGSQIVQISHPNYKQQNLNGPDLSNKISSNCVGSGDILPENG